MHVRAVLMLAASAMILVGCDPVQSAWVDNESDSDVIVSVDGSQSVRVASGVSDLTYQTIGKSPARHVAVYTSDCALLAEVNTPANEAWLLLITVRPGGGIVFEHGANLSGLSQTGTASPVDNC
jgi:hypothetical protein